MLAVISTRQNVQTGLLRKSPFFIAGLRAAILCYVGAGRLGNAQKVLGEILRLSSKSRLSSFQFSSALAVVHR